MVKVVHILEDQAKDQGTHSSQGVDASFLAVKQKWKHPQHYKRTLSATFEGVYHQTTQPTFFNTSILAS